MRNNETAIQTSKISGGRGPGRGGCLRRTTLPDALLHDGQGRDQGVGTVLEEGGREAADLQERGEERNSALHLTRSDTCRQI